VNPLGETRNSWPQRFEAAPERADLVVVAGKGKIAGVRLGPRVAYDRIGGVFLAKLGVPPLARRHVGDRWFASQPVIPWRGGDLIEKRLPHRLRRRLVVTIRHHPNRQRFVGWKSDASAPMRVKQLLCIERDERSAPGTPDPTSPLPVDPIQRR
jgi:hypothetical protein